MEPQNNKLRILMMMAFALIICHTMAAIEPEVRDTVYFYKTWHQVINHEPAAMFFSPDIYSTSLDQFYFEVDDNKINYLIEKKYIAASLGDSIWLVNTVPLQARFDYNMGADGYVPLYFSTKAAFFTVNLGGGSNYRQLIFYIDFLNKKLVKINHLTLSELLEDYHDLQMRFEGMKDYKKPHVIEDYFFRFFDRASSDVMRPDILDLVSDE